ncbi:hypothetical protein DPMN_104776 [Dreissena polymorpha]|uniref:Uncharacterized protein n=1 Tax=Dreissena polymorpha TaxID=45954 RepID=A0A9D4HB32_DREPO|nr:hypothetical protein DPMN_104776 [Dreissena polymorpha]
MENVESQDMKTDFKNIAGRIQKKKFGMKYEGFFKTSVDLLDRRPDKRSSKGLIQVRTTTSSFAVV